MTTTTLSRRHMMLAATYAAKAGMTVDNLADTRAPYLTMAESLPQAADRVEVGGSARAVATPAQQARPGLMVGLSGTGVPLCPPGPRPGSGRVPAQLVGALRTP